MRLYHLTVCAFMLASVPFAAWAADDHAAAGGHHGEGGSKGLPQLDASSYPSQIFWLIVIFGFLYFIFSQKSLPAIAQVIENRDDRVKNDLDTAQSLKDEVADVQQSYEDNLMNARQQAADLFKKMEADLKLKSASGMKSFQDKATQQIADLEKSILREKEKAMDEMNTIASDIAIQASEKIIGIKPDAGDVREIVRSLHKTTKTAKAA